MASPPGGGHHVQLQSEAVRYQTRDVDLTSQQSFVVVGKDRQWRLIQSRHRHGKFPRHGKAIVFRQLRDRIAVLAVLIGVLLASMLTPVPLILTFSAQTAGKGQRKRQNKR